MRKKGRRKETKDKLISEREGERKYGLGNERNVEKEENFLFRNSTNKKLAYRFQ